MDLRKFSFSVLFRAYLYLTLAAFLITIFFACIIQGVLSQMNGGFINAIVLYLIAWFCLGAGAILFFKGKGIVRDVVISW